MVVYFSRTHILFCPSNSQLIHLWPLCRLQLQRTGLCASLCKLSGIMHYISPSFLLSGYFFSHFNRPKVPVGFPLANSLSSTHLRGDLLNPLSRTLPFMLTLSVTLLSDCFNLRVWGGLALGPCLHKHHSWRHCRHQLLLGRPRGVRLWDDLRPDRGRCLAGTRL
jgi:hypothetical protein